MSRADLRTVCFAALVLGAVLATLAMTGCGAPRRAVAAPSMDGAHRDQSSCEARAAQSSAPQRELDACYRDLGY